MTVLKNWRQIDSCDRSDRSYIGDRTDINDGNGSKLKNYSSCSSEIVYSTEITACSDRSDSSDNRDQGLGSDNSEFGYNIYLIVISQSRIRSKSNDSSL